MLFLSLGAGVQSTVMALLAEHGEIEKPDFAIFADTGWEPARVYEHLAWLETQLSFPLIRANAGNIKQDAENNINTSGGRFASMPFFLEGGGMGRRQCTNEYKIQPIQKTIRSLLGYEKGQRIKEQHRQWIGISTDEIQRLKDSSVRWLVNEWPLVELRMSRNDCMAWFNKHYPDRTLAKSACVVCPYKDNAAWRDLTRAEFAEAVAFDEMIRNHPKMEKKQYVHRDCIPLAQVDLSTAEDHGQISFLDECDGMCGV